MLPFKFISGLVRPARAAFFVLLFPKLNSPATRKEFLSPAPRMALVNVTDVLE